MVTNIRSALTDPELSARKLVPQEELGKPNDISYTVVFLASDESRFINGTAIRIDNGKSIIPGTIIQA